MLQARAFGFVILLVGELLALLVLRGPRRPRTRILNWIVATNVAVIVAVVYVPGIARLLKLEPFPPALWPVAIAIAAGATLWTLVFPPRRDE